MFIIYWMICSVAVLIDRVFGDPARWHPVMWIGKAISMLERKWNKGNHRYFTGGLTVLVVVGGVTGSIYFVTQLLQSINIWLWIVVEVVFISMALAQKSLKQAAMVVYDSLEQNDLKTAREKLGWIVGRDTEHLDESEIVRGVIETVSENTSDGITAPLFYALIFGSTGAWCYKAINTLDSMIGYKNERYEKFGFVAAKLDDVANFIPSRISGLLFLLLTKNYTNVSFAKRIKYWLVDAKKHPSPNSGYLEAATAYQLGIRLGGFNRYGQVESFRAYMGEPLFTMEKQHIVMAIQQMHRCTYGFFVIGGLIYAISFAWCECAKFI